MTTLTGPALLDRPGDRDESSASQSAPAEFKRKRILGTNLSAKRLMTPAEFTSKRKRTTTAEFKSKHRRMMSAEFKSKHRRMTSAEFKSKHQRIRQPYLALMHDRDESIASQGAPAEFKSKLQRILGTNLSSKRLMSPAEFTSKRKRTTTAEFKNKHRSMTSAEFKSKHERIGSLLCRHPYRVSPMLSLQIRAECIRSIYMNKS